MHVSLFDLYWRPQFFANQICLFPRLPETYNPCSYRLYHFAGFLPQPFFLPRLNFGGRGGEFISPYGDGCIVVRCPDLVMRDIWGGVTLVKVGNKLTPPARDGKVGSFAFEQGRMRCFRCREEEHAERRGDSGEHHGRVRRLWKQNCTIDDYGSSSLLQC